MKTIVITVLMTVLMLVTTGCCPGYQETGSVLVTPPALPSLAEPVPQAKKAPPLDWEKIKNLPYIKKDTPLSTTVSSPGSSLREIYISGGMRTEVKWAVIKELRDQGYSVTTRNSKNSFELKISLKKIANRIVCTAILYDQDNRIIGQGIGEGSYWWFRSSGGRYIQMMKDKMRYQGEIDAVLEAVRMVVAGN